MVMSPAPHFETTTIFDYYTLAATTFPFSEFLIAIEYIFTLVWTGYFLSAFEVYNYLPVLLAITATDNGGATATYALTINVKPINRAPVFSPKSCSVNFNDNQVGFDQ